MCNKAIVSEVKAFCKADLITALQNVSVNRPQNSEELQQSKQGESGICWFVSV